MRSCLCFCILAAASIDTTDAVRLKKLYKFKEPNRYYTDAMISSLPARRVPTITLVRSGPGWQAQDVNGDTHRVAGVIITWYADVAAYFITSFDEALKVKSPDGHWNRGKVAEGEAIQKMGVPYLQVGMKLHGVPKITPGEEAPSQLHFTYVFPVVHFDGRGEKLGEPWTAELGQLPENSGDGECCVAEEVQHRCQFMWISTPVMYIPKGIPGTNFAEYHCGITVFWRAANDECTCSLVDAKSQIDSCNFYVSFNQFDKTNHAPAAQKLRQDLAVEYQLFPGRKGSRMGAFRVKHVAKDKKEKGFIAKIGGVVQRFPGADGMTYNTVLNLIYKYVEAYSRMHVLWYNCQVFRLG